MAYGHNLAGMRSGAYQPMDLGIAMFGQRPGESRVAGGEQYDRRTPLPMAPSPAMQMPPSLPVPGPRGLPPLITPPSWMGQRLAGDVVPLMPWASPQGQSAYERLINTGSPMGTAGMRGINTLQSVGQPLDLMSVYGFPGGQELAPRLGRRR